jgi:hypothetical protein
MPVGIGASASATLCSLARCRVGVEWSGVECGAGEARSMQSFGSLPFFQGSLTRTIIAFSLHAAAAPSW